MTEDIEKLLDPVGWQLLQALQENARLSFRELGQRVGLASSSVAERVHRLEEAGIVKGYHAEIDLAKVGLPITTFIRMSVNGQSVTRVGSIVCEMPEVLECYVLAGSESLLLKVAISSVEQLAEFINHLGQYGQTTTSLVLSIPLARRVIELQREG